ncbi:MAG: hypothetical protein HETSPECPRED_009733 [Heterodermia speciosa]|uniref:Uncharacterized protein n=1 Tax=Heterodermia speciosa TaxID=116794 RepID=A0A8H3G993_9LECA|nr:MAG: hypothetical protein HETSPECPRED_009733 [Heterodermia speciosa]
MPVSSLPLFLPLLLLLNALPFTLPLSLPPRDTGPIPITNPVGGWPAAQSVTFNLRSFGLDPSSQPAVSDCLTAYSMGRFYDGWDGNICGNLGWFKGTANDDVDAVECYSICATYVLYEGVRGGARDFQCDFRKGIHGHCWMGYHPLEEWEAEGDGGTATQ